MLERCPLCESADLRALPFKSRQRLRDFPISECGNCSHRFVLDPPADEELKRHYDDFFARDERQLTPPPPTPRDRALVRSLTARLPSGARVLEIGANFGQTLSAFPEDYYLEGIELSESAARAAARNPRLRIHNEFFERVELPLGSYDCVLSLAVIEHLRDPAAFVARIRSLLKPGGLAVIMTGDCASWQVRRLEEGWELYHNDGHLHFFTSASLLGLLRRAGLVPLESIWAGPNPWTSRLPAKVARLLHCQTASLLAPWLFGHRPYGDLLYVWCRR